MKRAISMLILAAPVALAAPLLAEDIAAPPMPVPGSVSAAQALEAKGRQPVRNGVRLLARRRRGSPKPTMDLVNRLRDEA